MALSDRISTGYFINIVRRAVAARAGASAALITGAALDDYVADNYGAAFVARSGSWILSGVRRRQTK